MEFNRDIRPILARNCFACHGPDGNARQAGLRLDRRESAISSGVLLPGNASGSRLIERIRQSDPVLVMPPVATDKKLSERDKALLQTWVDQGAGYQKHWAYIKPQRPDAPAGPAAIDHLLHVRLSAKGLEPVNEADRHTLARRLSLDLRGLPPQPEEVDAFVRDRSPHAYERFLDTMLDSPHYGERMAVHWLDLVRYADTTGYHGDVPINIYPFRDYIVSSFNENRPFDVMTREQLAGDLLADATEPQLVASGYNRLARMTNEGGAQAREYLAKYATDRVRNVSTVWLGSTLGCAECHDHKFDPFLARDFYSMAAFFADIEEQGVFSGNADWGARIRVLDARDRAEMDRIEDHLARLRGEGREEIAARPETVSALAAYLRESLRSWTPQEPDRVWADCEHPDFGDCDLYELEPQPDALVGVALNGTKRPREAIHQMEITPGDGTLTALALELFPTADFDSFYLSEFEVRLLGREKWPVRVSISGLVPDREAPGSMLRDTLDGNYHTGWQGDWNDDKVRTAVFVFEKPLEMRGGERLQLSLIAHSRRGRSLPARFRVLSTDSEFPELPVTGVLREAVLAEAGHSVEQAEALRGAFDRMVAGNPRWQEIRALERRAKVLLDRAHESLVTRAVDDPRTVRILPRGNWMDESGEVVQPQVPGFLGAKPAGERRLNRLDLAEWITDPDHPLTARVFVNRLWRMFFGTGLSKSLDDLGSQGEPPANQELLDWLAVEFVESDWNVRHMVKTMLMSAAYRRSSEPSDELLAADPYNRLHGRQTMARIDAEFIRDSLLAASGLLNRRMGGPSSKPYQPAGYYKELNFPKRVYEADLDSNQFRRGLYTHWQRQYLHPAMKAFDAPAREECTAERAVSNTPLQSLALLNDPSAVEAARSFAARILRKGGRSDRERVGFAFREAFSRAPLPEEETVVLRLLQSHEDDFSDALSRAQALLATGITPHPADLPRQRYAAWTSVARTLFNKHEFLMRY